MDTKTASPEQLWALREYAKKNGRTWKYKLKRAWHSGADEKLPNAGLLRQVRNELGPRWLTTAQI
jgi:hypothetical protein